MLLKNQSPCSVSSILFVLLLSAAVCAQEKGWPTRPQPTAETHQFDALLGEWTFVEDLNLNNPKAPPTVKGAWRFARAGDGFMINDEFRLFEDSIKTIFLGETYRSYNPDKKVWEFQFIQPGKTSWQRGTSKVEGSELIDLSKNDGKTSRARFYNIRANHFSCDFEVFDSAKQRWSGKKHVEATRVDNGAQLRLDTSQAAQSGSPSLTPDLKNSLLEAREAVWRAWFSNDRAHLEQVIARETIAINAGEQKWGNHDDVLNESKNFVENGGKLVRLEFGQTEIQFYEPTAILYSKYQLATSVNGKTDAHAGRATEFFVHRGGK